MVSDCCVMLIADRFGTVHSTVVILYNEALPLIDAAIFSEVIYFYFFFLLSSVEVVQIKDALLTMRDCIVLI